MKCDSFFYQFLFSLSVLILCLELNFLVEKMDYIYGFFIVYLNKLKIVDVIVCSIQDVEFLVKGYEIKLS